MTRGEAIKNIKAHCYFANLIPQAKEALDMAIEALEQEPCEDCISREAAINCVTAASMCDPIIAQRRLKSLSSVQPKSDVDSFVDFLITENCEGCTECEPRIPGDKSFVCCEREGLNGSWRWRKNLRKGRDDMTDREKAIVMAYTGVAMLVGDKFSIYHKYIEDICGRQIYTHEMAFLAEEIKEKSRADFIELCREETYEYDCISREAAINDVLDKIRAEITEKENALDCAKVSDVALKTAYIETLKIIDKYRQEG